MKNNKSLGQHWLNNRAILEEIAELAAKGQTELGACDFAENTEVKSENDVNWSAQISSENPKLCVEIGPGLGTLTSSLLKRFDKVIAVEFDERLAHNLPGSFPGKNLEVVNGDILRYDFEAINEPYVVAGNIPYYITSPIIEKVLTVKNLPKRVVLLIQKEVAERIVDDKETMLSLFVKNRARVKAGPVVKREEFTPPPKVDSQVIMLEPYEKPVVGDEVFSLIEKGFRMPRKKLVHNLAGVVGSRDEIERLMSECGISPDARPGDVRLNEWGKMYQIVK